MKLKEKVGCGFQGDKDKMEHDTHYYLGIDIGTQSLKLSCLNNTGKLVAKLSVNYDTSFPQYSTHGGYHLSGNRATAPVLMWIEALDLILNRLQSTGLDLKRIAAVSGSAQQHGSIYWRSLAELEHLDPNKSLKEQILDSFTLLNTPIWADSSTEIQCSRLEKRVGGALKLAELTGIELRSLLQLLSALRITGNCGLMDTIY